MLFWEDGEGTQVWEEEGRSHTEIYSYFEYCVKAVSDGLLPHPYKPRTHSHTHTLSLWTC